MKRVSFIVKEWSDNDDACLVGGSAKSPFRVIKYLSGKCERRYVIHFYGKKSKNPRIVHCGGWKTKLFFKTLLQNFLAIRPVFKAFSESDVIQCHHPHFGLTAALMKLLAFPDKIFLVKAHGTALPELESNAYQGAKGFILYLNARVHYWIDRLVLRCADKVICSSKYQQNEMTELYRVAASKLTTIYNGFDPEFYTHSRRVDLVRKRLVFGFCGRVVPKKNILYCFDLCSAAANKGFEVELVLVLGQAGAIEDPRTYSLINECMSRATFPVRLHHDLSEKAYANLLASCDIGLVPSIGYESIPSVIYEFSAARVPVFATYDWGIPEILKQEYALTGNIEQDVLKICSMHGERLSSLVNDVEYYSYQHLADEYLRLYDRSA